MYFTDMFLTRGRLPLSSFLCFVGGFSMGSWLTLFHQLQAERDLIEKDWRVMSPSHEPFLLLAILIVSAPLKIDYRDTLRATWLKLNPAPKTVRHFFVIGTEGLREDVLRKLHEEQEVKNDLILLSELRDNYRNLTLKVTQGITYLNSALPFHYLLKVDDDSFARIDLIVSELEGRERELDIDKVNGGHYHAHGGGEKSRCFYWGFFDGRARVQKSGKWRDAGYTACDLYIPYALGGGYIMSKDCAEFIVRNQHHLKRFINEDVTIGTWLSVLGPERRHDVRFDTEYESRGCNNQYLIQHKISQADMTEKYNNLIQKGYLCTQEIRKRSSYVYDWTLPPSQCCKRNASVI